MSRNGNSTAIAVRAPEALPRQTLWNEFDQVRRMMDDAFGNVIGYSAFPRILGAPTLAYASDTEVSPDIFETDEELVFLFPIPGITPGELNIETTSEMLSIRGERKPLYQKENAIQHRQSYWSARMGTFHITYTLPCEINPNKVEAHYLNGVLELHLPKAEAARPKTVKVSLAEK